LNFTSFPSKYIWPVSGACAPDKIFIKVDLPAPLSPIRPTTESFFIFKLKFFSA
jgi:hypothetical protein